MPPIKCKNRECTYKGTECCTADKVEINCYGECKTAITFADMMRQKPVQTNKVLKDD